MTLFTHNCRRRQRQKFDFVQITRHVNAREKLFTDFPSIYICFVYCEFMKTSVESR